MEPVRTAASNVVMRGPTPDVGDAWTEVQGQETRLVWELSDEDRRAIAGGSNLELVVWQVPMPPVSLAVTDQVRISGRALELADRIRAVARSASPMSPRMPAGYWLVGARVLADIHAVGLARPERPRGVPTIMGRPIMSVEPDPLHENDDLLEFVPMVAER